MNEKSMLRLVTTSALMLVPSIGYAGELKIDLGGIKLIMNLGVAVVALGGFACIVAGVLLFIYTSREEKLRAGFAGDDGQRARKSGVAEHSMTATAKGFSFKVATRSVGVIVIAFGAFLFAVCALLVYWLGHAQNWD